MAQPSRLEGLGVSGCIKPRKNGELPSVRKAPDAGAWARRGRVVQGGSEGHGIGWRKEVGLGVVV
jgi:hypothetical protein